MFLFHVSATNKRVSLATAEREILDDVFDDDDDDDDDVVVVVVDDDDDNNIK